MNTATITGTVSTAPTFKRRGFVPTTDFDVTVPVGRRCHTLHVQALNDLAKVARRYVTGDRVAVTGYLNSEAFDMPDRSVWYRVKIVAYELDHHPAPDTEPLGGAAMIANPGSVVLTADVAHWADDDKSRTGWILHCLHRHNTSDWGELDQHDVAANDHALAHHDGRLLSSYPVPPELTDPADGDDRIWIITDDLTDPVTTILWPSDY